MILACSWTRARCYSQRRCMFRVFVRQPVIHVHASLCANVQAVCVQRLKAQAACLDLNSHFCLMGTLGIWICCFYLDLNTLILITLLAHNLRSLYYLKIQEKLMKKVVLFLFERILTGLQKVDCLGSFGCQAHQHAESADALRNSSLVTHPANQPSCQPFLSQRIPEWMFLASLCSPTYHKTEHQVEDIKLIILIPICPPLFIR